MFKFIRFFTFSLRYGANFWKIFSVPKVKIKLQNTGPHKNIPFYDQSVTKKFVGVLLSFVWVVDYKNTLTLNQRQ